MKEGDKAGDADGGHQQENGRHGGVESIDRNLKQPNDNEQANPTVSQ